MNSSVSSLLLMVVTVVALDRCLSSDIRYQLCFRLDFSVAIELW
jgi:hypothetical protein